MPQSWTHGVEARHDMILVRKGLFRDVRKSSNIHRHHCACMTCSFYTVWFCTRTGHGPAESDRRMAPNVLFWLIVDWFVDHWARSLSLFLHQGCTAQQNYLLHFLLTEILPFDFFWKREQLVWQRDCCWHPCHQGSIHGLTYLPMFYCTCAGPIYQCFTVPVPVS
jgi:hypothetical protein